MISFIRDNWPALLLAWFILSFALALLLGRVMRAGAINDDLAQGRAGHSFHGHGDTM